MRKLLRLLKRVAINNSNEQVDSANLVSNNLTKNTTENVIVEQRREIPLAPATSLVLVAVVLSTTRSRSRVDMKPGFQVIGCFLRFIGCTPKLMAETSLQKLFLILT